MLNDLFSFRLFVEKRATIVNVLCHKLHANVLKLFMHRLSADSSCDEANANELMQGVQVICIKSVTDMQRGI
jgi:hypothetical protein